MPENGIANTDHSPLARYFGRTLSLRYALVWTAYAVGGALGSSELDTSVIVRLSAEELKPISVVRGLRPAGWARLIFEQRFWSACSLSFFLCESGMPW